MMVDLDLDGMGSRPLLAMEISTLGDKVKSNSMTRVGYEREFLKHSTSLSETTPDYVRDLKDKNLIS